MDMAEDGSWDRIHDSPKHEASTISTTPIQKLAKTVSPTTAKAETGMTPAKAINSKQRDTQIADQPATSSSNSSSADNEIEDKERVSNLLERLGLDPDCKIILEYGTTILTYHKGKMGHEVILIIQYAL